MIRALDRGPGRRVLAAFANAWIRSRSGVDGSVHWDGFWIHRYGCEYFVDGPSFPYYRPQVARWGQRSAQLRQDSADYWYHVGRPKAGDTIVDVGAGIGTDVALFSSTVGSTGRVLAIEAHPTTFRMLEATCRWNALGNVIPVMAAIVHESRTVLIENLGNYEANTVSIGGDEKSDGFSVPGRTLDEVCREHGVGEIALLKMNIEGAERWAIRGMAETIRRTRAVCIACHDFRSSQGSDYCTRSEVEQFLTQAGFRLVTRDQDPRDYVRDHVHGVREKDWRPAGGSLA